MACSELALETVDSESERSSNSAASDSSESESKGENQQLHTSPTPTPTPYSPSPHIARHQATRSSRNKRFYRKLSQVPDGRSSSDSDIPERRSAIGESGKHFALFFNDCKDPFLVKFSWRKLVCLFLYVAL